MQTASMHILIVEDDADNARLLELALRSSRHGTFHCARAQTLAGALSKLAEQRIDVVLLDLTLPDSRGLETLAKVRARFRQVPVVILTGTSDQAAAVRALQEGAQDYLVKGQVDGDAVARSVRYVFERTRAEREHEATRVRLELAAEGVQLGIWEWDIQTNWLIWTKPMAEMFGIDTLEGTFATFDRYLKSDATPMRVPMLEHAIANRELYRREMRIQRDDGEIRWLESRGKAVYDEVTGDAVRVIGTMLDITARKLAEDAARERETTVEHLARVSLVGQMASGLAHELNQPLGAILNYSAVGQTQLGVSPPNVGAANKALTAVMDEARRAGQIIKRIRGFLRKQEPRLAMLDIGEIVEQSLELMRFEIDRAVVKLTQHIAPHLPAVAADAVQVEQVLVNLIYNAIDAMRSIAVDERVLTIRTELDHVSQGKHVRISVIDAGTGISDAVAQRLFEPFYTTKATGLGMGLNLSRTMVESMGGVISAIRNAGQGTCFTFTLPTATMPAKIAASNDAPRNGDGNGNNAITSEVSA